MNKPKRFRIWRFTVGIAPKLTCFWYNSDSRYHNSMRYDKLITFGRVWHRKHRLYCWELVVGSLSVLYVGRRD